MRVYTEGIELKLPWTIEYSLEFIGADTWCNMDGHWRHFIKWNKPVKEGWYCMAVHPWSVQHNQIHRQKTEWCCLELREKAVTACSLYSCLFISDSIFQYISRTNTLCSTTALLAVIFCMSTVQLPCLNFCMDTVCTGPRGTQWTLGLEVTTCVASANEGCRCFREACLQDTFEEGSQTVLSLPAHQSSCSSLQIPCSHFSTGTLTSLLQCWWLSSLKLNTN